MTKTQECHSEKYAMLMTKPTASLSVRMMVETVLEIAHDHGGATD